MLAAASMIVGNVLAVVQKNIKRLLAYSSIAQAGYIWLGVLRQPAGVRRGYFLPDLLPGDQPGRLWHRCPGWPDDLLG
jgi:hypothetical protein